MLDPEYVRALVARTLAEDIGDGDLTARLTPNNPVAARLLSRQDAVICGKVFFVEVFRQLDRAVQVDWLVTEGAAVVRDQQICRLSGPARPILTGERSAINLVQSLSGTATTVARYVRQLAGTGTRLLDTRKTIPGLRMAQKYAVRCGGGHNHRLGLFDGILIKENHLRSGETIAEAISRARRLAQDTQTVYEVEVESLDQLQAALEAGATRILLDNFTPSQLAQAVELTHGRAELEASGGIGLDSLRRIAETGVDYVSVGALTKNLEAVDLSLRFD
jgi:nicotinate-nucleotide pyrophosphorylase (carboxylating)